MEYIDKIYYINLDKRTDRKEEILQQFQKMDIPSEKIERFSAIENANGCLGCSLSHVQIMKMAKNKGYNNVLILEDDFDFLITRQEFEEAISYLFKNYPNFDVAMFSYNLHRSEYMPNEKVLAYARKAATTSGYLVNIKNGFVDKLIGLQEEAIILLEKTGNHKLYSNDQYWDILQGKSNWYFFIKRIGKQRASYSDIWSWHADYNI